MTTKQQSGFSPVPIIVGVIAVGVLGFVGYKVLHKNGNTSTAANSVTTTNQSTPAGKQPDTTPVTAMPAEADTYLHIKELGIKIKLPDGIKDTIYKYTADPGANGSQYADISTQSLTDKSGGSCGLNGTPIAKVTETNDTQYKADNNSIFKVGNNYFIVSGAQGTCSNNQTVQNMANDQRTAFREAFKMFQLDN